MRRFSLLRGLNMNRVYCTNCGAEFRAWECGDITYCNGCMSTAACYYGTEAGMMVKLMRIRKNRWRKDSQVKARKTGLN